MRVVAVEMSAAVYHNCEWLYEQIRRKCEENGTEYTSRGLRQKVTSLVKGYTRQILKAVFSEYSDTGSEECLIYMKLLLSAMRINSSHGNVVFRKGPDNDEIQAIIIDELLLDTDIQMLYELLCIDKWRLISKMRYKPGAADEYVEARRAECIQRKETAEPESEPEPEPEPEQPKRKCMTEEQKKQKKEHMDEYMREYRKNNREKLKEVSRRYREENRERLQEYQTRYREKNREQIREYQKQYREKMKQKKAEEAAKKNL